MAYALLLREAPKLTLEIIVTDTDVMLPLLRKGELDMVITLIPECPHDGLDQEHLYDDEYVVCASSDHRLVKQKRVSFGRSRAGALGPIECQYPAPANLASSL